jgi:hypothetical protein
MKRIDSRIVFALAFSFILLAPAAAHGAFYSQIYNFAADTYDGSYVRIYPHYHSKIQQNFATIKGALDTNDYEGGGGTVQIGWAHYPGWSSPKIFHRQWDMSGKIRTDIMYASVPWNAYRSYKIRERPVPLFDHFYDYFFEGENIATTPSQFKWYEQRWYAGALQSQAIDKSLSSFDNFSLVLDATGALALNSWMLYRHDSRVYYDIYFFANYYDFQTKSLQWYQ